MGQTVVAIAIVVGVVIALVFYFRKRSEEPQLEASTPPPPKENKSAAPPPSSRSGAAPPPSSRLSGEAPTSESSKKAPASTRPPEGASTKAPAPKANVPKAHLDEDEDDEITIVTLTPRNELPNAGTGGGDDGEEEPDSEKPAAVPIIYDEEAAEDEPTRAHAVILVSAVGQTDLGQKRKVNEDRYLALEEENLYVVADGMGGHAGGEIASQLAVDVISEAFKTKNFEGEPYTNVPRRGGELALAIQMANQAIFERAKKEPKLAGMGTTIVSARFTPGKERVYIGHVGDSRCYRFRAGQLTQITTDHTMGAVGMTGPFADHLSRAVGIGAAVKVDMIIAKPRHDDVFLLCSDGLSKMVKDDGLREVLNANPDPNEAVKALVERANAGGGRDNITVILVVVKDPKGFTEYVTAQYRKKKAAEAEAEEESPTVEAAPVSEMSTAALTAAADEADRVERASLPRAGTPARASVPEAPKSKPTKKK